MSPNTTPSRAEASAGRPAAARPPTAAAEGFSRTNTQDSTGPAATQSPYGISPPLPNIPPRNPLSAANTQSPTMSPRTELRGRPLSTADVPSPHVAAPRAGGGGGSHSSNSASHSRSSSRPHSALISATDADAAAAAAAGNASPLNLADIDGLPISDEKKARIVERHLARPDASSITIALQQQQQQQQEEDDRGVGPSRSGSRGKSVSTGDASMPFPSGAGSSSHTHPDGGNGGRDDEDAVAAGAATAIAGDDDDDLEEIDDGEAYLGPHAMQGGAITDDVYRWAHNNKRRASRRARSESLHLPRTSTIDPDLDANAIKEPGGFRRYFVINQAQEQGRAPPRALRSFIDFLSLYGHFAGEDLEEEDDEEDKDDLERTVAAEDGDGARTSTERSALLGRRSGRLGSRHRRGASSLGGEERERGDASVVDAVLMLLKSFVGTGILFLGKAFFNGGLLFSTVVLCAVALISLLSFLLLVETNLKVPASFGDMGGKLYGPRMRLAILSSIVFSQLGFVAAYTVFVAQNLQAFILAVTHCRTLVPTAWLILAQCVVFMPLSLVRKIARLSSTALVADVFILAGIIYLFQYEIRSLASVGVADVVMFNPATFPLFIGTAVFTFEGIGLVIPITESMREPEKFPRALSGVMFGVTALFATSGALSYMAFGSRVQTVVISNLPQQSHFVQALQFLYSLAILLSTPLQLFPAVSILERGLFSSKSGKHDSKVKLQKNLFRCSIVVGCSIFAWLGSASLDVFVSFIGSVACVPLCFIYPPLLHLRGVAKTQRQRGFNYAILAVGVVFTVFAGGQTIRTLLAGGEPDKPPECHVPPAAL